jgi:hypothetical protein
MRRRVLGPGIEDEISQNRLVALWEALPASASHQGGFEFLDASRSLFEAVAGMTSLLPLLRELDARLEADVESKDVDA